MLKGRINGARKLLWIQRHGVMPSSRGGQPTENRRRKTRQITGEKKNSGKIFVSVKEGSSVLLVQFSLEVQIFYSYSPTILQHLARHLLVPARQRRLSSACTPSASPLLMDNCHGAKAAPEGGPCQEYKELCWALSTGWFFSRTAPIMLHNLLMEIHPEFANSSTRHCNAYGRSTGDTLRVIRYSF